MDVQDLREHKHKLERDIGTLIEREIRQFTRETGEYVRSVTVVVGIEPFIEKRAIMPEDISVLVRCKLDL